MIGITAVLSRESALKERSIKLRLPEGYLSSLCWQSRRVVQSLDSRRSDVSMQGYATHHFSWCRPVHSQTPAGTTKKRGIWWSKAEERAHLCLTLPILVKCGPIMKIKTCSIMQERTVRGIEKKLCGNMRFVFMVFKTDNPPLCHFGGECPFFLTPGSFRHQTVGLHVIVALILWSSTMISGKVTQRVGGICVISMHISV